MAVAGVVIAVAIGVVKTARPRCLQEKLILALELVGFYIRASKGAWERACFSAQMQGPARCMLYFQQRS